VQRFLVSAWLSYRALFTWLNPWGYVSTRLVSPIALAVIFGGLVVSKGGDPARVVVGGPLLAAAAAGLFGVSLAVGNERRFGTLSLWLAAPRSLLAGLIGKATCHVIDGLLGAVITGAVLIAVFGAPGVWWPVLAAAVVAAMSGAGAGLVCAAMALRFRDQFTAPNLAYLVIALGSGVFVRPAALGPVAATVAPLLPANHAASAALSVMTTGHLDWPALGAEVLVAGAWGALGTALVRRSVTEARWAGTLELG
jgi:ABC-2 type transport system permease protein